MGQPSPARRAWQAAGELAARGFSTPEVLAAVEQRRAGMLRASFFVTREVEGAVTADVAWHAILADLDASRRQRARRAFARALGDLFRRLHASGIYHNDLKDVNVLVRGALEAPDFIILDLEAVRIVPSIARRRRQKNLVQLMRTLGRQARGADRARFLAAYLGPGVERRERRRWAVQVSRRTTRKDRRHPRQAATGRPRPRVSVTIICQDEEGVIRPCLESVVWSDEVVVVDGGSRDGTADIARDFTDRVITNPWPGYSAQKQVALDASTGDWVLNVDADERVTPELAAEIRAALARVPADVAGFAIPRLVCYLGRWWYRGGWYPRRVVRLVRRSATRWGGTDPHEHAVVKGRVMPLRWPILHYSYSDIADHLRSANHLTTIAAAQNRVPQHVGPSRLVVEPAWRFVRAWIVKRGALDGMPGFFVAATGAFYVFLRWAKVWERRARERNEAESRSEHR
jgi:glycosyltransferase involved in cell wall biosynthesis